MYVTSSNGRPTIGLALTDLSVPGSARSNYTLQTSSAQIDIHSSEYIAELRKLLVRSKGSSYEQTIQKFIDLKNQEISETLTCSPSPTRRGQPNRKDGRQDSRHTSSPSPASQLRGSIFAPDDHPPYTPLRGNTSPWRPQQSAGISPARLDISGLDSIKIADHNQDLRNNLPSNDKKKWLDHMSQPLERHSSRESTHGWFGGGRRTSTNHLGRQRPPSWEPPVNNANHSEREHGSAAVAPSAANTSLRPSTTVSIKEFDSWLQKNGDWKAAVREKIQKQEQLIRERVKQEANLKVDSKTAKLADKHFKKMVVNSSPSSMSRNNGNKGNNEERPDGGTAADTSAAELSVFQRLTLPRNVSSRSPGRPDHEPDKKVFCFEPEISSYTRKLVDRRRTRAVSAGSSRPEDIGIVNSVRKWQTESLLQQQQQQQQQHQHNEQLLQQPYLEEAQNAEQIEVFDDNAILDNRNTNMNIEDLENDVPGNELQYPSRGRSQSNASIMSNVVGTRPSQINNNPFVSNNQSETPFDSQSVGTNNSHSQSRGRPLTKRSLSNSKGVADARSASPTVSNLTRSMSADRIRGSTRSMKSRSPSPRKAKQWILKEETSLSKSQPFKPLLIATETVRIMSRQHEAFDERMAKSVDNFFVNKAVAERACSPGPMHYATPAALSMTGMTPLNGSAHRTASPGRTGYKWGKEVREAVNPVVPSGMRSLHR